jgi:crossover junction endodeoxyribonuclease RuvC
VIIIGIDPGLTGAIALFNTSTQEVINVIDIPTRDRAYGKGGEVDWATLNKFLQEQLDILVVGEEGWEETHAVMENVGVMPKQGIVSAFQFGQVNGGLKALLEILDIPYHLVHPVTWKKSMGLVGTGKTECMEIVKQIPSAQKYLKLAKHHNRADAIAIAITGSKLI